MKKLEILTGIYALLLLIIFVGCSGDIESSPVNDPENAQLSFAAVLNNPASETMVLKQEAEDYPKCSNDPPAFVEVVITRNNIPVAGTFSRPLKLKIDPDAVDSNGDGVEEYISDKASSLELEPGNYTLEHFSVLDSAGEVIWTVPQAGKAEENIAHSYKRILPYQFSLAPGNKKHLDLEVMCINNALVINPEEFEALKFCIFGTYCNENGRHAEAMRVVASIWKYSGDEEDPRGALLYDNVANEILVIDNFEEETSETVAEPLCFSLPNTSIDDQYYIEVTLGSGVGYEVEERVIRSGVLTEEEIISLFEGVDKLDYYHIREGNCNLADSPQILNTIFIEDPN